MNVIWHYWQRRKNFYPTTAVAFLTTLLFCCRALLTHFDTIPQPQVWGKVIILVTSNAPNFKLRQTHRRAYSQDFLLTHFQAQRIFLVAQHPEHSLISAENQENDILWGSFPENYRNLNRKHLMGLAWATSHCTHPDCVIIKMDDDIAVDLPRLIDQAKALKPYEIGGWIHSGMRVRRGALSKWSVSTSEFANATYPDFVSGWVYAARRPAVQDLVAQASRSEPFWIDDVWLTGLVRQELEHLKLEPWNHQYTPYQEHLRCCLNNSQLQYYCDYIAGPTESDR